MTTQKTSVKIQTRAPHKAPSSSTPKPVPKGQPAVPPKIAKGTPPQKQIPPQHPKPVQNKTKVPNPWTPDAAKRIQRSETLKQDGIVRKDSFAAEVMSRTAKLMNAKARKIDL